MYEVFFISYHEINADEHWLKVKTRFPAARRINDVKGIRQAHIVAAEKSWTDLFYVVDGDADIVDDFSFDYKADEYNRQSVHVWHSINPVNDLRYGYGAIKLLPKKKVLEMDFNKPDMTTSISENFVVIPRISNITKFNTDPFNAYKSAFRECCKLASKVIDRNYDEEDSQRLESWKTLGRERKFGEFVIEGARDGSTFGEMNIGNLSALSMINDFEWLRDRFAKRYG